MKIRGTIVSAMFALNFYPDIYENLLRSHRKTVTIRLGDKTDKYRAGQLVWVTVGNRFARRHKLFTAIIDRVEVKPLAELTPRDISRENPEFRTAEDVRDLLERIYDRPLAMEEIVTVIYFSPVEE